MKAALLLFVQKKNENGLLNFGFLLPDGSRGWRVYGFLLNKKTEMHGPPHRMHCMSLTGKRQLKKMYGYNLQLRSIVVHKELSLQLCP